MIYCALIMAYCVIRQPYTKPVKSKVLPVALTAHAIITTLLVASPSIAPQYASPLLQFVCFHVSFAALESYLLYKVSVMYVHETNPRMRRVFHVGLGLWIAGLACWVLDYFGCDALWEGEHGWLAIYLL